MSRALYTAATGMIAQQMNVRLVELFKDSSNVLLMLVISWLIHITNTVTQVNDHINIVSIRVLNKMP